MLVLEGYNNYRLDRDPKWGKTRGGGLIVYAKDDMSFSMVHNCCHTTPDIELISLKLELKNVKEIYILGVYHLPEVTLTIVLRSWKQ